MLRVISCFAATIAFSTALHVVGAEAPAAPAWKSANQFRALIEVDSRRSGKRSDSPVSVEIDFQKLLADQAEPGVFDLHTVEVFAHSAAKRRDASTRLPHRVDRLFGATKTKVTFAMPDHKQINFAVYFDTVQSKRGNPRRYAGLVGDGDFFREEFKRRDIAASHFDQFVDFDGDGDLDLFKGGVEPYVYCFENAGRNRFIDRGRLASDGNVFKLPCSSENRSWVTVAFHDIDGDGDQDFFPSFGDGPDRGKIVFYRNTSVRQEATNGGKGALTFSRVGPLETLSGAALASGAQAGGWFPSITFVNDWDGAGQLVALVGSNHHCWLYRCANTNAEGVPRFADAVAVQAGGKDIELGNPRFDVADIDADGALDLFAGTQPGAVHWFRNVGSRNNPIFAPGVVIAWTGKYLIADAHSGVKVADFDGDGLPDVASGRFWERTDLNEPGDPRVFGGFFRNVGRKAAPRFKQQPLGGPFTERFQICDAIQQNSVRAVDTDGDEWPYLFAGDTDGFVWLFEWKEGDARFPLFTAGKRLRSGSSFLSVNASGGHARFDSSDWDDNGVIDLIVADGSGTVTLFHNRRRSADTSQEFIDTDAPTVGEFRGVRLQEPFFTKGTSIHAGGAPLQIGSRSSVLVCDWNNDGRKDLLLADDKGYYFSRNTGSDAKPRLESPKPLLFGGRKVTYARPNLGAFVDWDGDGKRDLIGCHFENSVRFYRNVGSGAAGAEPQFEDPEGIVILRGESPQMISGADVIDWNGDGDLYLLTGQGHGGSGLRFYERDWLEDELKGTHPVARIEAVEKRNRRHR